MSAIRYVSIAFTLCLGLVASLPGGPAARLMAQEPVARFSALAVDMLSTNPGAGTTSVNIVVNRWSTDQEHATVIATLLEKGERALLDTMRKMPRVGSVAPVGGLGFDLRYARATRNANGVEQILLLTDRQMSFWERADGGRTTDYAFTLVELNVQPSGSGEGRISVATKILGDQFNKTIVFEDYNTQPVRLHSLKRER